MNIQQNLNTLLAMGAVGVRTSDLYQTNVQYRKLGKEEKNLSTLKEAAEQQVNKYEKGELSALTEQGMKGANKMNIEYAEKLADIKEQKANLKPNQENIVEAIKYSDEPGLAQKKFDLQKERQASQEAERERKILKAQTDYIENTRAQRDNIELRQQQIKQDNIREILKAARKTYGGK